MTATKTKPRSKPQRVKLRAIQRMFYGHRLIEEGEVFLFEGPELPSEEVAVPAEETAPLGEAPKEPADPNKAAPSWTTSGFVDQANRAAGRESAGEDL